MKYILQHHLKSTLPFILLTLFFSIIYIISPGLGKIPFYLFLTLCFYNWNINPKTNKTWLFFSTLPITTLQKYIIKIAIPFLFSFILISSIKILDLNHTDLVSVSFLDAFKYSFIFTLCSIWSTGIATYTLYIILFQILFSLINYFHFYVPVLIIFICIFTYFYISEKPFIKKKFAYYTAICAFCLLILANIFITPIYKTLLTIPVHPFQLFVANKCIDNKIFITTNEFSNFPYATVQVKIDDNLLEKIEHVVVSGNTCTYSCYKLAHIVQTIPAAWNADRLSEYLSSNEFSKNIYGLELIQHSQNIQFLNKILILAQSQNKNVQLRALALLNNWGIQSSYDIPNTQEF